MRILILDPFHGAAGDMITGALLDSGADRKIVLRAMAAVVAEPAVREVNRAGIRALKVDTHASPVHRTIEEVMACLDRAASSVPAPALAMARRVFERIRAAESAVHGAPVHFHEVGADDAIADVIGACTALHALSVDGVRVLPITLGHGTVTGSHGIFPVPAPATAAILRETTLSVTPGDHVGELCTPTGAALLAEFAVLEPGPFREYSIRATGYGAGSRDPQHAPNVLRALLVDTCDTGAPAREDTVDVLETNVDDVSGEVVAHALARFMEEGARDASAAPVIMKKGRPGLLVRVICLPDASARLAETMARELGTLGIRCTPMIHRFVAERTITEIEVSIGTETRRMPVKCGMMQGRCYLVKAEFGPAEAWARELGLPVRDVVRAVEEAGRKQNPGAGLP